MLSKHTHTALDNVIKDAYNGVINGVFSLQTHRKLYTLCTDIKKIKKSVKGNCSTLTLSANNAKKRDRINLKIKMISSTAQSV